MNVKWDVWLLIYCLLIVFATERLTTAFHTGVEVQPLDVNMTASGTSILRSRIVDPDKAAP